MNLMNGAHQFLGAGVFEQIAQRARFDGRKDLVVGGKAGQHQDARSRLLGRDLPRGFNAVQLGHDQVHQDHVGAQGLSLSDGLCSIAGLANDLHVTLCGEQARECPCGR